MPTLVYAFGDYRLDIARRELWQGDRQVVVQMKVFDTLAWLVEHRDRAVGRDELIAAVWGKVDVSDNVLGQIVGRARLAVGDNGDAQRCIRTVLRYGYRWVAPTQVLTAPEATAPGDFAADAAIDAGASVNMDSPEGVAATAAIGAIETIPVAPPAARRPDAAATRARRGLRSGSGIALAVLVLGSAAIAWRAWRHKAPATTPAAVVLPVEAQGGADYAWVRLGVADLLSERLHAAGQAVVPTDAVIGLARSWRGAVPDAQELDALTRGDEVGLVLRTRASFGTGHWRVQIQTLRGRDPPLQAQGESADVLEAARLAFDDFAAQLGLPATPESAGEAGPLAGVLRQVRAAVLADRLDEALVLLDGLDASQRAAPDARFARALVDLGAGRVEAALVALEKIEGDGAYRDDPLRYAQLLLAEGRAHYQRADFARARQRYELAVSRLDGQNGLAAQAVLGRVLLGHGAAAMMQHDTASAQADYARSRLAMENAGDKIGLARLDNNVGLLLAFELDRPEAALSFMAQAADRSAQFADVGGELRARITLISLHLLQLDTPRALAEEKRLNELATKTVAPSLHYLADLTRVRLLIESGRTAQADAILHQGPPPAGSLDEALPLLAHGLRAQLALAAGAARLARDEAEAALRPPLREADARDYAKAWITALRARRVLGEAPPVALAPPAFADWAGEVGGQVPRLYAELAAAEAHTGDPVQAAADYARAQAIADTLRIPSDLLEVARSHAEWRLERGDANAAVAVVERVAPWADRHFEAAVLQLRLYHALGQAAAWRAALERVRHLAGEREVPAMLATTPVLGAVSAR